MAAVGLKCDSLFYLISIIIILNTGTRTNGRPYRYHGPTQKIILTSGTVTTVVE